MISHMNKDHVDAMRGYCKLEGIQALGQDPVMLAIDHEGFEMLVNGGTVRILFKEKCTTPQQVREALVKLAEEARK